LIMSRYPKIGDRSNPYKSRVVQKLTLTGVGSNTWQKSSISQNRTSKLDIGGTR
jgi:hypothetical protein